MGVEAHGEVAGGAGSVAEAMDPAAEANELFSEVGLERVERRLEVRVIHDGLLGRVRSHRQWVSLSFVVPEASEVLPQRHRRL